MKRMYIRSLVLGTVTAGLIAGAGLGATTSATAAPTTTTTAAVSQTPTDFDYSKGIFGNEGDGDKEFRHTFTKEETQQMFDAAKAGGIMAATATCMGFMGEQGGAFCGPASEAAVGVIAKQFEPKGRCLQIWMAMPGGKEPIPIGGKYVECPAE